MEPAGVHAPVLLAEVLSHLRPRAGEVHLDGTVGGGGHAAAILARLGSTGLLIGIDRDEEALAHARGRLAATGFPFRLYRGAYSQMREFLRLSGLDQGGVLDGVLLDLGVSSLQLDRPERGFSFLRDGPLDMRMACEEGESARDYLRGVSFEELCQVLRDYGEEAAAGKVARAIVEARGKRPLDTTLELARVVESVLPRRGNRIHSATRTFQALRIVVNRELEHLRLALRDLDRVVKPGGRVVVLSYHSLEDRIVKDDFRARIAEGIYDPLTPKPVRPTPAEVASNPRSRSARLRAVRRAGGAD